MTGRWVGVDLLLVSVFAVVGRLSHAESLTPAGWWQTAWPFLVGALLGHALLAVLRRPPGGVVAGAVVAVVTVVAGMLLRRVADQGTAPAFVVVALVVLSLLLVGARLAAHLAGRLTDRGRHGSTSASLR
ncbi:MAG TPA: DUF3054 domain-containing protein [Nocardioides sp.]|uniref:DUF3054 domain-containing protein n=1 Tax=Nocardioides sp. TaxID=35761 RepID=UPI002BE75896|nr:DUF3054 domain-containing protein [Nocardioides sp.]HQR28569.1 DUF3054 domain-containing protein [Nocardioides sp.]